MKNRNETSFDMILDLCNLEVDANDREIKLKGIESLLEWVGSLNKVNVENIEPLTHLHTKETILMEDFPKKSLSHADVLNNAPSKNANYILIPKVK